MNTQDFLDHFNKLINNSNNILITSHKDPDDDSIGSVLSLFHILSNKYSEKNLQIIYSTEIGKRHSFLEDFNVIQTDKNLANKLNDFDLIIFLDLNRFSMFSDLEIKELKSKTVCIDHHATAPDNFDLLYIDPNAVATCQIIYNLYFGDKTNILPEIAKTLFLGISGDTRNFEFVNFSQSEIFSIAEKLIKAGKIDVQDFLSKLYTYSENVFKIIQEFMKNSKVSTVSNWQPFFSSFIDQNFVSKNGFNHQEVDTAAHIFVQSYATSINKAPWGYVLSPNENEGFNISIRSRTDEVNVRFIMEKLNIGGGHDRAAGGTFKLKTINECLEALKIFLENNQNEK